MSLTVVLLWLGNIIIDTLGQLAFKAGASQQNDTISFWRGLVNNPWIILGASCYLAEFLLWLAFLSLVPLSEGVLLGSINIVVIMLAGRALFKEQLTPLRIAGILLVATGVGVVGFNS